MKKSLEVLCSEILQHEVGNGKKETMALSKGEVLPRARNYKVKASVSIERVQTTATIVVDTRPGPNLLTKSCLPQTWASHTIRMKAAHLRSAASTQLEVKRVILLEVQLGQGLAEASFLLVTILVAGIIVRKTYIDENIENTIPKKDKLKSTSSSTAAV